MKKYLALLLMMALAAAPAALAEDAATPLPCGVSFEMDGPALVEAIGGVGPAYEYVKAALESGDAEFVPYFEDDDTETGNIQLSNVDLGIGGMTATFACFDVQRINSAREPRLSLVSVTLDPGDNSIASFRSALEALTGVYGEPDNNPFDEAATDMYVEYGMLDASWVKEDVRIYLSLQRMYEDYLELSFSPRICFDASDLDA